MPTWRLLIGIVLLTLLVLAVLWVSRVRGESLEHLNETEGGYKVAVVVAAPEEEDGLNQYSLPTLAVFCNDNGYDLIVRERRPVYQHMIELVKGGEYDYVIGASNKLVCMSRNGRFDDVLTSTKLARAPEDLVTGWMGKNLLHTWSRGADQLFEACLSDSFLVVHARQKDAVDFLERCARDGYVKASPRVEPLPSNAVYQLTGYRTQTGDNPLIGFTCARSDQMCAQFETLGYDMPSLESLLKTRK